MSSTTIFYAVSIALVLLALGTSAVGIRNKDFPSAGVFRAGVAFFAALVVVTSAFALLNARDEQAKHRAEKAHEAQGGESH